MPSNQNALQDLLAQYKDVFEEIQGWPPMRDTLSITLILD